MATQMSAWRSHRFGLDAIQLDEILVPTPGATDILVRVGAVSLNARDKIVIEGAYDPGILANGPLTLVSDAAGTVAAIGAAVTRFKVGDRVTSHLDTHWVDGPRRLDGAAMLGGPLNGGLADYMLLPESGAVFTPAAFSDEEAATLPTAALTAWLGLHAARATQPGDTVLVQGTGNVAVFALQLAVALGASVLVTTSQDEKGEQAQALGASHVINYTRQPAWGQAVLDLTQQAGVHRVLEVVGGDLTQTVLAAANEGVVAIIGFLSSLELSASTFAVMGKQLRLQGVAVGPRKEFEALLAFLEQHPLKPVIEKVYAFAEAPAAFAHLARGGFGKVVIRVAS